MVLDGQELHNLLRSSETVFTALLDGLYWMEKAAAQDTETSRMGTQQLRSNIHPTHEPRRQPHQDNSPSPNLQLPTQPLNSYSLSRRHRRLNILHNLPSQPIPPPLIRLLSIPVVSYHEHAYIRSIRRACASLGGEIQCEGRCA